MSGPAGLLATSAIIRWPKLPGRGEAPTSATLVASSIARSTGRWGTAAGREIRSAAFSCSSMLMTAG